MTFHEALYFGLGAVGIAVLITLGLAGFLIRQSMKKHGDK